MAFFRSGLKSGVVATVTAAWTFINNPIATEQAANTDYVFEGRVSGDAFPRVRVRADGRVYAGDGTGSPDTLMVYRAGANQARVGSKLAVADQLLSESGFWQAGGQIIHSPHTTANFSADEVANYSFGADTSGGAWTLTVPDSPVEAGTRFAAFDYAGTFGTNALTITTAGGTTVFGPGSDTSITLGTDDEWIIIEWDGARYRIAQHSSSGAAFDPTSNQTISGAWDFDNDVIIDNPWTLRTSGARRIHKNNISGPGTFSVDGDFEFIEVDTSSAGTTTLTLPASPNNGRIITVKDSTGNASANNIVVDANGDNIDGQLTKTISTNYGSLTIVYGSAGWLIRS